MKRNRAERREGTSLLDTHLGITPFYSEDGKRFLALCFCSYHTGIVHPSAYFGDKSCVAGCKNLKVYYLPERELINEEEIINSLKKSAEKNRNSPTIPIDFLRDEKNRRYAWVMDRGSRVYIARPKKLHLVQELEKEHFRLFL